VVYLLRPKDSEGTCIPSGVTTFLQTASRRSLRAGQPALDAAQNTLSKRSARLRLSDVWLEARVQRPGKLITMGVKLLTSACLAPLQQKNRSHGGGVVPKIKNFVVDVHFCKNNKLRAS